MLKKLSLLMLALAMIVILTACGGSEEAKETESTTPEKLRFAVTDVEGMEELQRDFEAFRAQLETTLGLPIEFFAVADRSAAIAALKSDQIDVLLTGPAEYVIMKNNTNVSPLVGIQQPNYHSQVVVWADSPIKSMADLKGKTVAMSDVGSTSGHLAPAKILKDAGIDPMNDVELVMLGDAYVQALKNKDVDAWAGGWKHFERFIEKEGLDRNLFRVLQEGPLLPSDIFVASSKLSAEYIETLRTKMMNDQQALVDSIISAEANAKYTGTEIKLAEDSQYDYVREMYEAIGVTDLSKFVE
jgi:phosphonate transport system substrate-binding protein